MCVLEDVGVGVFDVPTKESRRHCLATINMLLCETESVVEGKRYVNDETRLDFVATAFIFCISR